MTVLSFWEHQYKNVTELSKKIFQNQISVNQKMKVFTEIFQINFYLRLNKCINFKLSLQITRTTSQQQHPGYKGNGKKINWVMNQYK